MEKRVVINNFELTHIDYPIAEINLELVHDKDMETHVYTFAGEGVHKDDWQIIQDAVCEHEGILPLELARQLWDILTRTCHFEHKVIKKESLWG
jgi:hypothetical protein